MELTRYIDPVLISRRLLNMTDFSIDYILYMQTLFVKCYIFHIYPPTCLSYIKTLDMHAYTI